MRPQYSRSSCPWTRRNRRRACPHKTAAQRQGIKAGAYARIRVVDTGGGIRPDIIERSLDLYFTTKKAHAGTGMGLAIVHGIVTRHNGAVDVDDWAGGRPSASACP